MRLIDADALKAYITSYCAIAKAEALHIDELLDLITNAPTVQREGWVSVPTELIDRFPEINMGNYSDDSVYELNNWGIEVVQSIQAAPKDKEYVK